MTGMRRWIVAGLLVLAGAVLHAQPVSFADLARHDQYKDVKISPDGKYLAATAVVKGQTVLALIRLSDKKGSLVRPLGEDDVIDFQWVSPTRVVYAVGVRLGGYDSPLATGELFAVNADGTDAKLLYGYRAGGTSNAASHIQRVSPERGTAELIASIPDDPHHILVAISSWNASGFERDMPVAYRMDVRDGMKSKIVAAPMRGVTFVADHQGRIRFAYAWANDGSAKVYQYPIGGGGWQLMQKRSDERSFPWAFSRDDSVVYFNCLPGSGLGMCELNPTTGAWKVVWSNPVVAPASLVQGMAEDDFIGVGFLDGRPGVGLFEGHQADTKALIALMKQFPGESVRFTSGTRDGRLSVVQVQADADPGTFYLYDRSTHKLTLLLSRASWIDPEQMASKQPFEFTARDGLKLQGYVSYPPGEETARHLPMVVFVHGGPYGIQDDWDFDPYVQAMATRGYAVLQVNYRGSGGRGYDFMHAGWGEWGGKMQDDVTDATRWAIAQGIADPQRICIFGGSYGGYAALEGAVKEPDLYKCAIGYVGVYDLALMYRRGDIPQSSYGESYLKQVLGEDMHVLAQRSPIDQLDRLKAHVMLVVGGKDTRVPPIQGSNLHVALNNRHIPHVWIDKPNEMHGFYDEGNLTELYMQIVQFLGANIGPGVTAGGASAGTAPAH